MSYPPMRYYWPQGHPSSHAPAPSFGAFTPLYQIPASTGPPFVDLSGATQAHHHLCPCRLCVNSGTRRHPDVYEMAPREQHVPRHVHWEQHVPRHVQSPALYRAPFLHRLLDGTRDVAGDPPFQVDLRAPILFMTRRGGDGVPGVDWNAPATDPMLDHMRVVCDLIPKWPIDILVAGRPPSYPLGRSTARCLIVSDILITVHASLQTPITREEWARLTRLEAARVSRAFKRRCDAYPGGGDIVRRRGIVRVDFLAGRCCFRGLVWRTPANGVHRAALVLEDV
ncbi:hypothetical protein PENSPDRAFT_731187 [Peniophora sp. CONT]|nr:hypothetical protein PENSPDRAFT_731187 [Peniophora sp. CONT]